MRTGSLRAERAPVRALSEVTTKPKPRRRIRVAERAEVVAVHADDDWFELFADEQEPKHEKEKAKDEAPPPVQATELARFRPEAPPELALVLRQWRSGPWPGITGALGILLGAGVLVFAARSLGGATLTPADTEVASTPSERLLATVPPPIPAAIPAAVPVTVPPSTARATNPRPPERSAARSEPADAPATRPPSTQLKPTPTPSYSSNATSIPPPIPNLESAPTPAAAAPPGIPGDASAGAVSPPPSPAPSRPSDSAQIRTVLDLYRQAYSALDADAVEGVWPSVNTRSLARAFGQLESQKFEFSDCRIDLSAERAQATCTGKASFVPKIGGRSTRSENREWAFVLVRFNDGWIISRADSR